MAKNSKLTRAAVKTQILRIPNANLAVSVSGIAAED
jgi:hypothetical protein